MGNAAGAAPRYAKETRAQRGVDLSDEVGRGNPHLGHAVHADPGPVDLDLVRVHRRVGDQNLGVLNPPRLQTHTGKKR